MSAQLDVGGSMTLDQLQAYISTVEKERGFDGEDVLVKCLLLGEEVGELFKAVRSHLRMKLAEDSAADSVADEVADVLSFLVAVANRLDVDVGAALADKERRNRKRVWRVRET